MMISPVKNTVKVNSTFEPEDFLSMFDARDDGFDNNPTSEMSISNCTEDISSFGSSDFLEFPCTLEPEDPCKTMTGTNYQETNIESTPLGNCSYIESLTRKNVRYAQSENASASKCKPTIIDMSKASTSTTQKPKFAYKRKSQTFNYLAKTTNSLTSSLKVGDIKSNANETTQDGTENVTTRGRSTNAAKKTYTCKCCQMVFASIFDKLHHERIHSSWPKLYWCGKCFKTYRRIESKRRHEQQCNQKGEVNLKCKFCDIPFLKVVDKMSHENSHTEEKPYHCKYCSKQFIQASHKRDHECIHTGEKPHTCTYCTKAFIKSSDRIKHERTHTGEKPYSCQFCGKSFSHISNKHQHERIHSDLKPYSCKYCGKTFKCCSHKINHEQIHMRERKEVPAHQS